MFFWTPVLASNFPNLGVTISFLDCFIVRMVLKVPNKVGDALNIADRDPVFG